MYRKPHCAFYPSTPYTPVAGQLSHKHPFTICVSQPFVQRIFSSPPALFETDSIQHNQFNPMPLLFKWSTRTLLSSSPDISSSVEITDLLEPPLLSKFPIEDVPSDL